MKKSKKDKPLAAKILKTYFIAKSIAKIIIVSYRIYELVPKYETFDGVDANKLIAARMAVSQKTQ